MRNLIQTVLMLLCGSLFSQEIPFQGGHLPYENAASAWERFIEPQQSLFVPSPPPYPVRHMAEWEELQALCISWNKYPSILTQIALHASKEVKVMVFCNDEDTKVFAENALIDAGATMENIEFSITPNDSDWIRDYGPTSVYKNDIEDLNFIDWVYNRTDRPIDDILPAAVAPYFDVPLYSTTEAPYRLVNTGGNFMSDGLGNAFASKLVLQENGPGNPFGVGPYSDGEIDAIMNDYLGISRYVKFDVLPFDGIHHIDMHMKLLDEETLLIGQYPNGLSDGPQIEANIQYLLDNFKTAYGNPYKVVRIVQPPDVKGVYPPAGEYRTYTNSVFVNKTILIPIYDSPHDSTAFKVYREHFPGYKLVGINCNNIIGDKGALHCITKEVGSADPFLITLQKHPDVEENELFGDGYTINARLKHKSGIAGATLYFSIDSSAAFLPIQMEPNGNPDEWTCNIPQQPDHTTIYYYVSGKSNSQKTGIRPLTAPAGYFKFKVSNSILGTKDVQVPTLGNIYPNPANAITVVPVRVSVPASADLSLYDVYGQKVNIIFSGQLSVGESRHYFDASDLPKGMYFVTLRTAKQAATQKLVVR